MLLEFNISGSEFTMGLVTGVYERREHVYNDNIKESNMENILAAFAKIPLVMLYVVRCYVVTAQNNGNEVLLGTIAIGTKRDFKKTHMLFEN